MAETPEDDPIFGRATVRVRTVATQTLGIAEEIHELREELRASHSLRIRGPRLHLFPPRPPVYDQFQLILSRIGKARKERDQAQHYLTLNYGFPPDYRANLEAEHARALRELRAAQDEFWELNCPDPVRRVQERTLAELRRQTNAAAIGGGTKPPPPATPAPPDLTFVDLPRAIAVSVESKSSDSGKGEVNNQLTP